MRVCVRWFVGWARAILLVAVCTVVTAAASAQTVSTIEGHVRGPLGAVVSGATVVLSTTGGDSVRRALAGSDGVFLLLGVTPGTYVLTVRAIGLTPLQDSLDVPAAQRIRLTYRLTMATTLAEVQVRQSRTLDIHRLGVSSLVSTALAEELPIARRSPLAILATLPGVRTFAPQRGQAFPFSGAGPAFRQVNIHIDGISLKNMSTGNVIGLPQTGAPFPMEATREMRFSMSNYGGEQAHGAAWSLGAVTERGDDTWRGSFFTQLLPSGVTARTFVQRAAGADAPPSRQLVFGGSARGAIVRKRLYYAGSADVSRLGEYADVAPTTSAWSQYRGSFEQPGWNATALQRLTWVKSDSHEIDAMWLHRTFLRDFGVGGRDSYDAGSHQHFNLNTAQLRSRRVGARSESEWSAQFVSWVQEERPRTPGSRRLYPGISFGNATRPWDLIETQARLVHRGARQFGNGRARHLIRYGADVARFSIWEFKPDNKDGSFRFATDTSTLPNTAQVALGTRDPIGTSDAQAAYVGTTIGAWITDEWRPTDRLLLSAGLRYDADLNLLNNDFVSPWVNDPVLSQAPALRGFLADGKRKDDLNNIAPRLSFSFDPTGDGRTFLRGGFGVIFDRVFTAMVTGEARSATWRTYDFVRPGTVDVNVLQQRVRQSQGTANVSPIMVKSTMQAPEMRSWSLGVGHRLSDAWALNIDFLHQRNSRVFVAYDANPLDSLNQRSISSQFGQITIWDDNGSSLYDAILSQLTWSQSGAQLQMAYTLGWSRNDSPGANFPIARYAMEPTPADERHRFVVSGFKRLPWGLTLSTITTMASPRPYTALDGRDLNRNAIFFDDFAFEERTRRPAYAWKNWYRTMDVRVGRELKVGATRYSASLDVFNVFNAANVSAYGDQRYQASVSNPIASFGQPVESYAARSIQLAMRVLF